MSDNSGKLTGRQYIDECRRLSLEHVQNHYSDYIDSLAEKLFQIAEKADNDQEQRTIFEARKQLLAEKQALLEKFVRHINNAFKAYAKQNATVTKAFRENLKQQESLSLVDNDELEESIALKTMGNKADNRCAEQLYALNKRLSAIRGGTKIAIHNSPIEASVFCEAIQNSANELSFDTKMKLIAYKVFDAQFMGSLAALYEALNQQLMSKGILSNLRYEIGAKSTPQTERSRPETQQRITPEGKPAPPPNPGPGPGSSVNANEGMAPTAGMAPQTQQFSYVPYALTPAGGWSGNETQSNALQEQFFEASARQQQQLFDSIQQMQVQRNALAASHPGGFGGARSSGSSGGGNSSDSSVDGGLMAMVPYSQEELINNLSAIQATQISTLEDKDSPLIIFSDLGLHLEEKLEEQSQAPEESKKTVSQLDSDLIELVGLLFDCVLNNENLPNMAKALFSYLHTPFLKLALQDRAFFELPQHPARQLLNSLVEAGERWLENSSKQKNVVYEQMHATVHRILNEFDDNVALFSELAFDFSNFMRQHQRRVQITEGRTAQAASGEDKLQEIRQKVAWELDRRTAGKRIPEPIITLLYEPWSNFMSFNLLRFSADSEEWTTSLRVVDEIIWYIEPKVDMNAKKAADDLGDALLPLVKSGFKTVGYDEKKGDTLIKSVELCHRLSVEGIEDTAKVAPIFEPEPPPPAIELTANEKSTADKLLELQPGTWFVLNQHDPQNRRLAKLAWSNKNTGRLMLVNKLGQQLQGSTVAEMAKAICADEISILDESADKPFIERALQRILEKIS